MYSLFAVLLVVWSCQEGKQQPEEADTGSQNLDSLALPGKGALNPAARQLVVEWPEFLSLETSLDGFQRIENIEDLRLLVEEILEKEKLLSESEYPERLDKPQVQSRQKVFRTRLLKVKAQLEYRTDPRPALSEMMEAYNALTAQLNVIANNNLDTDLITDE
jgi:hypothetical protein